jgi:hypothetical protein
MRKKWDLRNISAHIQQSCRAIGDVVFLIILLLLVIGSGGSALCIPYNIVIMRH